MNVSILICTYQRATNLRLALPPVVEQARTHEAEIIVVDNGSTDDTAEVVRAFPDVRLIREEQVGLCQARNRGWREATAPIVAFLDDDAIVQAGWLTAMLQAFAADPEAGCVGGSVVPDWEVPRPTWLSHDVALGLTIVEWPGPCRRLTDLRSEWLVGANMACRVSALEAVGGFHPWLDRRGSWLLSSGDVFLQERMLKLGFACTYQPDMRVRHPVSAERVTKPWLRRRYFWQGVSNALMTAIEHRSVRRRLLMAVAGVKGVASQPGQLLALLRPTDDAQTFEQQCWTCLELGRIAGLLGAGGH